MNRRYALLVLFYAAFVALSLSAFGQDITYTLNPVNTAPSSVEVTLTGTITTDGTLGNIAANDIVSWSLTAQSVANPSLIFTSSGTTDATLTGTLTATADTLALPAAPADTKPPNGVLAGELTLSDPAGQIPSVTFISEAYYDSSLQDGSESFTNFIILQDPLTYPYDDGYSNESNYGVQLPPFVIATVPSNTLIGTDQVTTFGSGIGTVGGGQVTFPNVTGAGNFTSNFQIATSQEQLVSVLGTAAAGTINFGLAGSLAPGSGIQCWDLHFTGAFTGSATVTLQFDPSLLGGAPPSSLEIWHFTDNNWVPVPGTVDPIADTITFTTDSFSPFVLGVMSVPEPSSLVLAACGLVALVALGIKRRRHASRA